MGSIFDAMTGMMGADPESAFGQMAGELGISPAALGITGGVSGGFGKGSASEEYAMQTQLEFVPIPMLLLKLIPIDRPVPINSIQYVPVKQPSTAANDNKWKRRQLIFTSNTYNWYQ